MAIDLKNLKPTTVSRDLRGKFVLIFGPAKVGKTTLAVQFPKNLLLAVEHGFNAIDNIYAVDVPTWGEFKKYIKQLQDNDLKKTFNTITIDTIGLLYERCEAYICDREGVDKIGDIPYGAGFKMLDKEFEENVRKITQILDESGNPCYGLCLIAHDKVRIETDGQITIQHITPDLSERCAKIINRMVDLTAYIGIEDNVRYIYPRQTTIENNKQITEIYAGSHFANLNDKIELSYENLVNAIADAMEYDVSGKKITLSEAPLKVVPSIKIDYKTVKSSIGKIAKTLNKMDEEASDPHYMDDYKAIVDKYLGKNKLVKDTTESQAEHLQGILDELEEYIKTENIIIK